MIQSITNHLYTGYPTWHGKVALLMCAIPAAEMAIRFAGNCQSLSAAKIKKAEKDALLKDVSRNLAGALLYGICATNALPYSSYGGALIYSVYAGIKYTERDSYHTARLIGKPIRYVATVSPILETIWKIASAILTPKLNTLGRIFNALSLPKNPAWYGVMALTAAIIAVRVYPRLNGH